MVIAPSTNDWVERAYQVFLLGSPLCPKDRLELQLHGVNILLRGLYDDCPVVEFPYRLAKKIESFSDSSDLGFVSRQYQASGREKTLDQWFYIIFQQLPRATSNDEVICVPHQIYLVQTSLS